MPIIRSVTPVELNDLGEAIASGECVLIDVREGHEHAAGHIPGSVSLPMSQLEQWKGGFSKDVRMVLYCRTSNRSRRCAELLLSSGYSDISVLDGGYAGWSMARR